MIDTVLLLCGSVLAVFLSGFFSGSETGVYCLNRLRLRVASAHGDRTARRVERVMERPEDLVITALLGTNIADYLATACIAALLMRVAVADSLVEVYATLIVTPLILVFGGIIPKDWFRKESNRLLGALSWPLTVCLWVARSTGIVWALRSVTHVLLRWINPGASLSASQLMPRARTLHLLREGALHGGLTALQRNLIERVLNLSDIRVGDVMVPRGRAAMVKRDMPRADFLRVARMAHFSHLPVYGDDPRKIVGVVTVFDVITDEEERPVAAHVRPPVALPAQTTVPNALLRLQGLHEVMGIVEDRAGQCVGILTIKDLVEEIVGDLEAW